MADVWLTSDLHIGHGMVATLRGYNDTAKAHDAALGMRWDAIVKPRDQVWVLGDISAGGRAAQLNALEWIKRRPGVKHLIAGNHDGCHPMYRDSHKWQRIYLDVFESVQMAAKRRVPLPHGHTSVMLSHFPYASIVIEPTWGPDEWRELIAYPGYAVHPDGHVRGRFGRVLKPYVMPTGYHQVTISGIGKRYVHRLVAEAFHGRPVGNKDVAHNNGDKGDNRAVNLRWATRAENNDDKYRHGTQRGGSSKGPENPNAKLSAEDVTFIRQSCEKGVVLAQRFGITDSHVSAIRLGRSWRANTSLDHTEVPRYEQYRLPDVGGWLLHGHTQR